MEYEILLLNVLHGKTKKGNPYTRIGYVFLDDSMTANNPNFIGVTEFTCFVNADTNGVLDVDSILKKFIIKGEMVKDYKNPFNQIFVPTSMYDKKANYEISLSQHQGE